MAVDHITNFYDLFILTVLCTLICIIMFSVVALHVIFGFDVCLTNLARRQYQKSGAAKDQIIKPFQYLSICSLLSFIICLLSQIWIIHSIDKKFNIPNHKSYEVCVDALNTISWATAQLFIYLLFVFNLKYTFKDTILQLSKYGLIYLISLIILFFVLQFSNAALYVLYYYARISSKQFSFISTIIVGLTEFVDLILSMMLVYIFVNRLFKLFVLSESNNIHHKSKRKRRRFQQKEIYKSKTEKSLVIQDEDTVGTTYTTHTTTSRVNSETKTDTLSATANMNLLNDYNNNNLEPKMKVMSPVMHISHPMIFQPPQPFDSSERTFSVESLNIKQKSIVNTASKYAIISCIAIISTQIYLVSAVNNSIAINESQSYYNWSFRAYSILLPLDCFINSLCIVLNFEFNHIWFRMLCCICDDCCHSICKCASKKYLSYQK